MIDYDLNLSDLEKRMSTIYSWEEWHLFESEFFDEAEWSEKSIDVIDEESEIKSISYNGAVWKHIIISYDLPSDYYYLYEYCSDYIFKKLEPKQHLLNTESQGKWCAYCKLATDRLDLRICPFCGRKLFNRI